MLFQIIAPYEAKRAEALDKNTTLGIEVTVPAIAEKCGLGNIDHHGDDCDSSTPSACEQAYRMFLNNIKKFDGIETVVGCMPDSDTITAMAVIEIFTNRQARRNVCLGTVLATVTKVGLVDRLGPAIAKEEVNDPLVAAIIAVSGSRTHNLQEKIGEVILILFDGKVSKSASKALDEQDKLFEEAKENSKVEILDGGVVYVESTHHAATRIGYEYGDIVICFNPEMKNDFRDPSKGTYRKFTICKRDENVKMVIDYDTLNNLEPGWGGRTTIGGSPQGKDSILSKEEVLSCLKLNSKD